MTEQIHPDAFHYRCIDNDFGGTYTHRPWRDSKTEFDADTLAAIGTYGCSSCVGVYMKLSPTTCFVAHINASHVPIDYPSMRRDDLVLYDLRIVTDAEGGYVRAEVIRRLNTASRTMNWPPVDQIRNVVLVCPVMKHPLSGATLSGTYIVQAIREFLGRWDIPVNTESEGFVVWHDTGAVRYFPWLGEVDGPPLPDNGRDYVAHKLNGEEWPQWFINIGRLWCPGGGRARAASVGFSGEFWPETTSLEAETSHHFSDRRWSV